MTFWDNKRLRDVTRNRRKKKGANPLGMSLNIFLKRVVIPRQKKLSIISHAWQELLPQEIVEHSCLESLNRGQLRVLVDNTVYLSELNMIVRAGMLEELRMMCPSIPLSKIKIVYGRWYHQDDEGNRIAEF